MTSVLRAAGAFLNADAAPGRAPEEPDGVPLDGRPPESTPGGESSPVNTAAAATAPRGDLLKATEWRLGGGGEAFSVAGVGAVDSSEARGCGMPACVRA